jgi:hypothetical protein
MSPSRDSARLAAALRVEAPNHWETSMLETIRRSIELPRLRLDVVLAAVTTLSFGWLLLRDLVHPFAVLLLQLYLSF